MNGTVRSVLRREETTTEQFAAIFMGVVANYFLWGIQFVQTFHYYKNYRQTDATWLKSVVVLLFVADAVQTLSCTQGAWKILVANWGDVEQVNHMGWGLLMVPFTDSFTASIVHGFYAHKIWSLLEPPYNYVWTLIIFLLSCAQLTAGAGESAFGEKFHLTFSTFHRFTNWATIWFVTATATDVVITILMTWKLSKSRTGYKETNEMISKLIRLTIETGLATSVIQILCVIIQHVFPDKSYVIFPGEITPKLYSNSMLALLNSRRPQNARVEWSARVYRQGESLQLDTFARQASVNNDYPSEGNNGKLESPSYDQPRISLDAPTTHALPFRPK